MILLEALSGTMSSSGLCWGTYTIGRALWYLRVLGRAHTPLCVLERDRHLTKAVKNGEETGLGV